MTLRTEGRKRRHVRIRKKVTGTPERPRLCIYRSLKQMYAQIVDDVAGHTLVSASSANGQMGDYKGHRGNREAAGMVGQLIAKKAIEKGIKKVVFDRSGYLYHGRVKALADAAREAGLEF